VTVKVDTVHPGLARFFLFFVERGEMEGQRVRRARSWSGAPTGRMIQLSSADYWSPSRWTAPADDDDIAARSCAELGRTLHGEQGLPIVASWHLRHRPGKARRCAARTARSSRQGRVTCCGRAACAARDPSPAAVSLAVSRRRCQHRQLRIWILTTPRAVPCR